MIPAFIALGLASIPPLCMAILSWIEDNFYWKYGPDVLFTSSLLFFFFSFLSLILSMKCCVFVNLENSTNVWIAIALRWLLYWNLYCVHTDSSVHILSLWSMVHCTGCALSLSSESYILRLDLYFFLIPTLLIRKKKKTSLTSYEKVLENKKENWSTLNKFI